MIHKVKEIKNKKNDLDKKSKELVCAAIIFFMVALCVVWDNGSFSVYAAGKDIKEIPHTIKAGDTELAVVGSYNEGKLVIEEIKEKYGEGESITDAIIEPVLEVERKELAVGEKDPDIESVEEATKNILAKNSGENPIFNVTVESSILGKEAVDFKTEIKETSSLEIGKTKVAVEGEKGISLVKGDRVITNGKTVKSTVYSKELVKSPVTRVIYKGTKAIESKEAVGSGVTTGRLIWPIPSSRNIVSGYGGRIGPIYGNEFHMGYDISGRYGANIVAADGGTVVKAGYHSSYGYQVVIQHSNGLKTRYAHNSKLKVKVGQRVSQGQLIALCGSTGASVASHLHFEVWENGRHVNPKKYL